MCKTENSINLKWKGILSEGFIEVHILAADWTMFMTIRGYKEVIELA